MKDYDTIRLLLDDMIDDILFLKKATFLPKIEK